MEQWKPIPESEGRYSVSDLGRIRREAYSFYAIKEAVFNGADRNHVASEFGTTRSNVTMIMSGITWGHIAPQFTVGKTRFYDPLSEEGKTKMINLIKSGVSPTKIAEEIGCSLSWVCKIKKSL